jgi:hypothetical protein
MISGNLEYLLSSLPYLNFSNGKEQQQYVRHMFQQYSNGLAQSAPASAILASEAQKFLSPKSAQLFHRIQLSNIHKAQFHDAKPRVIGAFSSYSYALKNQIRDLRVARRKGLDVEPLIDISPGNPMEEEVQLLQLQWNQLEALSIGHYANFSALLIYKLKLMILERWWQFDTSLGLQVFQQITKTETTWPTKS